MRYLILAVFLVAAIIGGLLYLPERFGEEDVEITESGTKLTGDFVDLAPPAAPDYSTVVTDEALAQELGAEAEGYLQELSAADGKTAGNGSPLLLTKDSKLSWAGENGSVGDLLARYGITPEAGFLYYAHPVTSDDIQGVWGIVQTGLISRFAEGIAIRRGDSKQTYKLLIPQNADERNHDGTSSFLGKVIWHKTIESQVINTKEGWARQSVNLVVPNQDLVIVSFARQELVAVYQYFALQGQR